MDMNQYQRKANSLREQNEGEPHFNDTLMISSMMLSVQSLLFLSSASYMRFKRSPMKKKEIASHAATVLWSISQVATSCGISLEELSEYSLSQRELEFKKEQESRR